ncbi:MAG: aldehyde dehydrogenase [Methanospirillum sp.]|nr:aldehyde dehydrogenase [Methanospirillum sp.]
MTFEVRDPASGEVLARLPLGTREDIGTAVEAAEAALPEWSARTMRERGRVLERAAALVRARVGQLARQLTAEQGKPLREATDEIRGTANVLEYYSGISANAADEFHRLSGGIDAFVLCRPIGVTGAIIPWNMPALIFGWKVGAALLAGNTLVLKPASGAPLTPLSLAQILGEAGLPAGALNLVTGAGEEVGEALVLEPRIRKISFTGSLETGRRIYSLAAQEIKRVTLELGGSDPMIICADADFNRAISGAVAHRFYNCGQVCTSVKRLFVHESIAPALEARLENAVTALQMGRGTDPGVRIGPMNSHSGRTRVACLVDEAVEREEGRVLCGGQVPRSNKFAAGNFYEPTLIMDVVPGSRLLREEVFGPVLPVTSFTDMDQAIALANDSPYGLGASVWTSDPRTARDAIERLQAGIVWVNHHTKVPPEVPFGGVKQSGLGRENGLQAIQAWSESKSILINKGIESL